MEISIITADKFRINNWSGGTTKELYIFPSGTTYTERNFKFRLSSATVEVDKSDFTSLPGVSRKLMVLSGQIKINHEDQYSKVLHKFDQDTFEGKWKTSSIGQCVDFNLMTTGQSTGQLRAMGLGKNRSEEYKPKELMDWLFLYVLAGKVAAIIQEKRHILLKGDLLVIHQPGTDMCMQIEGIEESVLVFADLKIGE